MATRLPPVRRVVRGPGLAGWCALSLLFLISCGGTGNGADGTQDSVGAADWADAVEPDVTEPADDQRGAGDDARTPREEVSAEDEESPEVVEDVTGGPDLVLVDELPEMTDVKAEPPAILSVELVANAKMGLS